MNVDWSFHFEEQFQRIIATIVQAQSYEDGIEWHERIGGQISLLANFPLLGDNVPARCFTQPPDDLERLRQLIISPYRVVYEIVGEQCRVLAIVRCSSMLVRNELLWGK